MNLQDLMDRIHNRWPWTKENYPRFPEGDEGGKAWRMRHILLHLVKETGAIANILERRDHGSSVQNERALRRLVCDLSAKVVMNGLELARSFDITAEDLIAAIDQFQAKAPKPDYTLGGGMPS